MPAARFLNYGVGLVAGAMLLAGCDGPPADSAVPAPGSVPAAPVGWTGRWQGPEGTFLELAGSGADYTLTIRSLDGERTFPAQPVNGGFDFERDGERETLRATDGEGTGMKWLADKDQCVVVRPGEGYCRDEE